MVIQCGNKFYDEHEEEIKEMTDKISNSWDDERVIKDYIQNFFDHFNGGRNSTALTGRVDNYFIEQTEKQRNVAEKIIKYKSLREREKDNYSRHHTWHISKYVLGKTFLVNL